jgi:hypothetical protein
VAKYPSGKPFSSKGHPRLCYKELAAPVMRRVAACLNRKEAPHQHLPDLIIRLAADPFGELCTNDVVHDALCEKPKQEHTKLRGCSNTKDPEEREDI